MPQDARHGARSGALIPRTGRLALPDAMLVYDDVGPRDAEHTLVFLHGAFADRHMWAPQAQAFGARYRVVCMDLRGHGDTGPTSRARYTIGVLADDLGALLDHLGIDEAVILGLSLGGMIAQAFAAVYPERVRALVLADTVVSLGLHWTDRALRDLLVPRWLVKLATASIDLPGVVDATFELAEWSLMGDWIGPRPVRRYLRHTMTSVTGAEYHKIYDALYGFDGVTLERIKAPALVICGRDDTWPIRRHAVALSERLPGARLVWLAHAGHVSNLEQPERFNEALGGFLRALPS